MNLLKQILYLLCNRSKGLGSTTESKLRKNVSIWFRLYFTGIRIQNTACDFDRKKPKKRDEKKTLKV